ncbi:ComEC/Rec2 family competence protein [Paenarthrobacter sp. S56]|uniref:ComEC/Rec2 family competence protein n=1 Tax=Paenarthrobacter sp. S56 TaxID=3138179 RepID=UPI00321AFA34
MLVQLRVTAAPEPAPAPEGSGAGRWTVRAELISVVSHGQVVRGPASLIVVGGDAWRNARPGQSVRTTGIVKEARSGAAEDAVLSAATAPKAEGSAFDVEGLAAAAREHFRVESSPLDPDAAGLLPGMVTGDTSALPEGLDAAMRTTGMTHLTAVSGANCALVLGAFVYLARSFRMPRPVAASMAATGLAAFVVLVGPDPSVLRAAVMGFVGVAALSSGLRGRSLSFLCAATILLLFFDPFLGTSVGFLLSVLATLGIILLARRIASWFPGWVPPWLAAGIAVPLSAQLLCGPVIVALQPQLAVYSLPANVVAGPLVAPVTILGTLAVPLASTVPWLAQVPIAVAGSCAFAVAGIARFFAGLPGASLPWPEGGMGIATMALFSIVTGFFAAGLLRPRSLQDGIFAAHGKIMDRLERLEGPPMRPVRSTDDLCSGHQHRRHGRLESCIKPSGRNHPWLLPKTTGPRVSPRTPSAGAMLSQPPWSWFRGRRSTWAYAPWTASVRRSGRALPTSRSANSTPAATKPGPWP